MDRQRQRRPGGLAYGIANLPARSVKSSKEISTGRKPHTEAVTPAGSRSGSGSQPPAKEKPSSSKQEYEEAVAQLQLIQEKLHQQAVAAYHLEREALEFYYANTICFEGYNGEPMPQQQSGSHHYYFTSTIARARQEGRERCERQEQQLRDERCRVERIEEELRNSAVVQRLEKERTATQLAQEEARALELQVSELQLERTSCELELQKQRKRQEQIRQEFIEREGAIRLLEVENKKQKQDIDALRLQLKTKRDELESAQAELRRRENVVEDLRQSIERLARKPQR